MNKDLITKRFGRKLDSYDENAKIQKQMAGKILSKLDGKTDFENILEIGCGTGLLTSIAFEKLKFNSYTANDIVSECEEYIKSINGEINFISGDIEEVIENLPPKKYDLILSNASFQWLENFEEFVKTLISKLSDDGILIFSTFGRENYREIFFVTGKTLDYYSRNELEQMFNIYSHEIEEEICIMRFKTPSDVLKHIQNTGANAISTDKWTKKDLLNFENGYNNFCSGRPTLTYNPIYVKITNSNKTSPVG